MNLTAETATDLLKPFGEGTDYTAMITTLQQKKSCIVTEDKDPKWQNLRWGLPLHRRLYETCGVIASPNSNQETANQLSSEALKENQSQVYLCALARLAFGMINELEPGSRSCSFMEATEECKENLSQFTSSDVSNVLPSMQKTFLLARIKVIEAILKQVKKDIIYETAIEVCLPQKDQKTKINKCATDTNDADLLFNDDWEQAKEQMIPLYVFIEITLPRMKEHLEQQLNSLNGTIKDLPEDSILNTITDTLSQGLAVRIIQMAYCCVQMHSSQEKSNVYYQIIAVSQNETETFKYRQQFQSVEAPAEFSQISPVNMLTVLSTKEQSAISIKLTAKQQEQVQQIKNAAKQNTEIMEIPLQKNDGINNNETRSAFVTARVTYQYQENYFLNTYQRLASAFDEVNLVIAQGSFDADEKKHITTMKATCSAIKMRRNIYNEPENDKNDERTFFFGVPLKLRALEGFFSGMGSKYIEIMRERQELLTKAWNVALIKWVGEKAKSSKQNSKETLYETLNVATWSKLYENAVTKDIALKQLIRPPAESTEPIFQDSTLAFEMERRIGTRYIDNTTKAKKDIKSDEKDKDKTQDKKHVNSRPPTPPPSAPERRDSSPPLGVDGDPEPRPPFNSSLIQLQEVKNILHKKNYITLDMPGTGNKCMYYAMNIAMHVLDIKIYEDYTKGMQYGADELKQYIADTMWVNKESVLEKYADSVQGKAQYDAYYNNVQNAGEPNVMGTDVQMGWWVQRYKINSSVITLQLWDKNTEYPDMRSFNMDLLPLLADKNQHGGDPDKNKVIFINSKNYVHFELVFLESEWPNVRQKIDTMEYSGNGDPAKIIEVSPNNFKWVE